MKRTSRAGRLRTRSSLTSVLAAIRGGGSGVPATDGIWLDLDRTAVDDAGLAAVRGGVQSARESVTEDPRPVGDGIILREDEIFAL